MREFMIQHRSHDSKEPWWDGNSWITNQSMSYSGSHLGSDDKALVSAGKGVALLEAGIPEMVFRVVEITRTDGWYTVVGVVW